MLSFREYLISMIGVVNSGNQSDDVCQVKVRILPRQQKATAFGRDVAPHRRKLSAMGFARGAPQIRWINQDFPALGFSKI